MSSDSNEIPPQNLMRKTIEQIRAERTVKDDERLAKTDAWSDEEITRRAQEDPDNPPLNSEQLAKMRAKSMPAVKAAGLLDQVEDEATLLALLEGIAQRLIAKRQPTRKAG